MPNRDIFQSKTATIRDFSGGWNVADNDQNLSSKFLPVSDNVNVGVDGSLSPRLGYELFKDCKLGTTISWTENLSLGFTNASPVVVITKTAHGYVNGNHITISGYAGTAAVQSEVNATHSINVTGANTFEIVLRTNATATGTDTASKTHVRDTHAMGGEVLEMAYFQEHLIIFTTIGEVLSINKTGTITLIWSLSHARALSGAPNGWRKSDWVSFDTFKQTLVAVNGRSNDKPIEISFTRTSGAIVQYLVDPATSSNSAVPRGDYIQCFDGYTLIYATDGHVVGLPVPTFVDISASGTSGVYVGNAAPDDAVQIDLGRVTQTVEPRITGVGSIRDRVVVTYYDSAILGKLGRYTGSNHEPDFGDQIAQHGAINHRVIANIGNDLLMTDYYGVPSFAQSVQSATIVPDRFSQLIEPAINKHFSRLQLNTLRTKPFALYNVRDREYMMFAPKFEDNVSTALTPNPFFLLSDFVGTNNILCYSVQHGLEPEDVVAFAGAVSIGGMNATNINGNRRVVAILDDNYFIFAAGANIDQNDAGLQGGGSSVTYVPQNDEMIGYIFTLNPQLRIRRWTRYRGLQFTAGCISLLGQVFFGYKGKIYRFGTKAAPLYADAIGDYDFATWVTSTSYTVGQRVKDGNIVYKCLVAHTATSGSFSAYRASNPTHWEIYEGNPIKFDAETPWSDFGDRVAIKVNDSVTIDAQGTDRFTLQVYVDNEYRSRLTMQRTPSAELQFVGKDAGGFGLGPQPFGGGRRVKEQQSWRLPFRCKLAKIRVTGEATKPLRIVTIAMQYKKGSSLR